MTTEAIERQRREIYEIAEAIAPGWERWRARIEQITAPVREWMIRELAPRPGDTVLELAAGAGDTGYEAAAFIGDRGRLISTDFSPGMVQVPAAAAPSSDAGTWTTGLWTPSASSSTPTRSTECSAGSATC